MDYKIGEMMANAFMDGVWIALGAMWAALMANPWLMFLIGAVIVGGIVFRLKPARRRRRRYTICRLRPDRRMKSHAPISRAGRVRRGVCVS